MALFRGHTSPYPYSYHVFLSFRGEDTRKNFTDHLYTALVNAGFHTFRDDPELERGENIKEKLENAIRQSRSSVIIFSKDYTSSRWCLDELVMILERKRTSDHVVLPVFFDVTPPQLRKKAVCLAEIPKYQANHSAEKLNGWRAALGEVADLAGMVLQNEADGHESKFIQNIVREIQDKLGRVPLSDVQELLQEKLLSIVPILNDAEEKQLQFPSSVKPWLHKLKDAIFDTEDLLQEIKTEALRQKIEHEYGSSTSKVQELICTPSPAFDSAFLYSRVERVHERLDHISKQTKDVLASEATAGHTVSQILPSTSFVEKSVYGRDEEKKRLVRVLLSDDESSNDVGVIPIVGMAGIGKTTLAQFVYNDVRVKQHFHIQAWVCVSKEFDVLRISQQIYESLTRKACKIKNPDLLQSELQINLTGKRFFFVLDDIWNEYYNQLEFLRCLFKDGAHGSKIIVTTRDEKVARMMGSVDALNLLPMSEEDSWSLFEQHAFKNSDVGARSHLEETGRQIVQNCNGLPLAIKSIGGLLCSKLNVGEWKTILDSEMWELPQEGSGILPSLWLSYKHLPPHLRRCFACCSIFPKNYEFRASVLVCLWKAEDLLQPTQNRTAEEIGEYYFNDLISRSFFQLSSCDDKLQLFTMHDLINDLASFVFGEFCFKWQGSDSNNLLSKTRHFLCMPLCADNGDSSQMLEALQQVKCLRTFLLPGRKNGELKWLNGELKWLNGELKWLGKEISELLPILQCLRVVMLLEPCIKELPDSISNLKLLRHLDLSWTSINKLPDTICALCNLEALLLLNCSSLTELPPNLERLINLSHLDIEGTSLRRMPRSIGELINLQTLTEFRVDQNAGNNLVDLMNLQNLRGKLCISRLGHSSGLKAYILRDKKFLNELVLDWEWRMDRTFSVFRRYKNEVFEKLQPHLNLERLTIKGYGGKMLPSWSQYYSSSALVYLKLVNCWNCVSLPPLGQLPSLKELHIERLDGVVSIASEFYYGDGNSTTCVNKPFRSLRSLKFENMSRWENWCYVGGDDNGGVVFPNLVELVLSHCPNLTGRLALDRFPKLLKFHSEKTNLSLVTRSPHTKLLVSRLLSCPNIVTLPDEPNFRETAIVGIGRPIFRSRRNQPFPTVSDSLAFPNSDFTFMSSFSIFNQFDDFA